MARGPPSGSRPPSMPDACMTARRRLPWRATTRTGEPGAEPARRPRVGAAVTASGSRSAYRVALTSRDPAKDERPRTGPTSPGLRALPAAILRWIGGRQDRREATREERHEQARTHFPIPPRHLEAWRRKWRDVATRRLGADGSRLVRQRRY